jgi:hypothetical protein
LRGKAAGIKVRPSTAADITPLTIRLGFDLTDSIAEADSEYGLLRRRRTLL